MNVGKPSPSTTCKDSMMLKQPAMETITLNKPGLVIVNVNYVKMVQDWERRWALM
jgi:hypothetical protein